jgi:DNA-binding XRE family transcriptional regulator
MTVRESKRKKLVAKGWKVGSAKDFLGLSPSEEAYIDIRLRLADGLKVRRNSRGVTQTQLAQTLRSSQSRVAKMEAGDPTVSLDLLVKSLLALGTSSRELAAIIARRQQAT